MPVARFFNSFRPVITLMKIFQMNSHPVRTFITYYAYFSVEYFHKKTRGPFTSSSLLNTLFFEILTAMVLPLSFDLPSSQHFQRYNGQVQVGTLGLLHLHYLLKQTLDSDNHHHLVARIRMLDKCKATNHDHEID